MQQEDSAGTQILFDSFAYVIKDSTAYIVFALGFFFLFPFQQGPRLLEPPVENIPSAETV
jgi:hypothetical protein